MNRSSRFMGAESVMDMPSEKMTALTMSGPLERLDEAIGRFVMGRDFHPEEAVSFLAGMRRMKPVAADNRWELLLQEADRLLETFGLAPAPAAFEGYDLGETEAFLVTLSQELRALDEEEKSLLTEDHAVDDIAIHHLRSVPESLRHIAQAQYIKIRVGRMPEEKWPDFLATTAGRADEFALETDREDGYVYLMALALPETTDRLDANLVRFAFERFRPDGLDFPDYTAEEVLARAEKNIAAHQKRLREIAARREALGGEKGTELLARRAWLKFRSVCAQCRTYAGQSHGRFYLAGWVPAAEETAFIEEFEREPGFSCVASAPKEVKQARPPVRIRDRGPGKLLTALLKMYGMPAYGTVDPRVFMVITYTVFFGMMFGDAGQGAVLAVLGFLLYKKKGAWLWRIVGWCGVSAIFFGLFYGSVFGMEHLLPWEGFYPLASENIMTVLLAGAALGIVVLVICMAINVVNALRTGDLHGAFFSPNGVAGLVLYVAAIAAIVGAFTGMFDLLKAWFVLPFLLLPIALIWVGKPLTKLLQGQRDWKPESWGMFVVEGFFEIFEAAISYMSNTMSFLRLGAFAISHAGMMMVVSMLSANAAATGKVIVMIVGNIFVAGLEAALSSIQIIRLEFYEIFGRFYISGGQEFAPVTVDYTT